MTLDMDEKSVSSLKQQLDELAAPVGFEFAGLAEPIDDIRPPDHTLVWESRFALLAVIVLEDSTVEALKSASSAAEEWIWRRMITNERQAKFIDGYLVFALHDEPSDDLHVATRELELDTSTCRKHVIWPTKEKNWRDQLWEVTVLGLPDMSPAANVTVELPSLPDAARESLVYYDECKSYRKAVEKLRRHAARVARKETSNAS